MRILKRDLYNKSGNAFVHLIPDDQEDLWYIYNLVLAGDLVRCTSYRKVMTESKTGSVNAKRLRVQMVLKIVQVDYFPGDPVSVCLKGKSVQQSKFINAGQFHSLQVELHQPISIIKQKWDQYQINLIKECTNASVQAEAAALVMDEGVAHLCYIRNYCTAMKVKVETNIPKKKQGSLNYEKAIEKFFTLCVQAIMQIDFSKIKCLVLASPGFVKDQFFDFLKDYLNKENLPMKHHLGKFLLVKSANGYLDALSDVLLDEQVAVRLKDTTAIGDVKALEEFYKVMQQDSDKVAYGAKYVIEANENNAVQTLLISDSLFRSKNFGLRTIYNQLVENCRRNGSDVKVFCSFHHSGEKLNNLGGVAAIMRFPLNLDYLDDKPDLEQDANENAANELDNDNYEEIELNDFDKEFFDALEQGEPGGVFEEGEELQQVPEYGNYQTQEEEEIKKQ